MNSETVESPCVNICTALHTAAHPEKICTGCYRTLNEIASWRRWPAETRRAVLAELPLRRARLLNSLRPAADE